jgi:predicted  nucleic acid-binding Zn-ribbon protein
MMKHIKDHPRYAELTASLGILHSAHGKIQMRISEIETALCTPADFDHQGAQVASALQFAETGKLEISTSPKDLQHEHLLLREKLTALNTAIEAKHSELSKLRSDLSAEVCEARKAEHKKMAARALDLIEQLDALMGEEQVFIRAMESAGYDVHLPEYIAWPALGRISDQSQSLAWYRHRDLSRYIGRHFGAQQ